MNNMQLNPDIFRMYDIRGIVGDDLTAEIANTIGKAAGTFLKSRYGNRLVVGMDNRPSSEELKGALLAGLLSTGCAVTEIGLSTSPLMYQVVTEGRYDGGIIVTASHNPKEYNGFKMVGSEAYPIAADDMLALRDVAIAGRFDSGSGALNHIDPSQDYLQRIKSAVRIGRCLKVVLDTGNGVAGKFAPSLLRGLGCDVVELHCDLDGNFPNHLPNPEHEANVEDVMRKVVQENADLGIAIDGDGDRIGLVDDQGRFLVSDYTIILLGRDFLARHPGATILLDVKSSLNAIDDIKRHGGVPLLYKTGHSLIKKKMRSDGIMLGGELSGHVYVFENYYPFDDALYASAKVLEVLSHSNRPLSQQFADLRQLYATPLIEIPCSDESKFQVIRAVVDVFKSTHEVNDIDGARVSFPGGWAIVRASNTTPVLTFRAEADSPERLESIKSVVHKVLASFPEVQLAAAH